MWEVELQVHDIGVQRCVLGVRLAEDVEGSAVKVGSMLYETGADNGRGAAAAATRTGS
jgi:hypothetical protein